MKLLFAPASPYSSKVRMAARYLDIALEDIRVNTADNPAELVENNPLGKIPTLITDDGKAIFDSRAIMYFLHRTAEKRLYPKDKAKRTEADVLEALADGISDCLLAIVYERRYRPPELVSQDVIDRQWAKINRSLDHLDKNLPKTGRKLHGGHFALAATLGYLMLRFPGEWENGRAALAEWPATFAKQFEPYPALRPKA
ncbi:MAG: glutathione S-transferase [Rhizobium sp.]|nr:glutathione S-transferase [Rhizobium sp.]